jgi:hypothetical protein
MATTTPAPNKPAATRKAAAPRKQTAAEPKGGKPLQFRFFTLMKPHRVYSLVVDVPRGRDDGGGSVVVVRPVIAGALVVPPEQRLDTSTPGNQATFHVTPLARGKLPNARVEVHVAGQPPQDVFLPMKAKTQRLAWALLILALGLTWLLWRSVKDDWKAYDAMRTNLQGLGKDLREKKEEEFFSNRGTVYAEKLTTSVQADWVKIPFVNAPFEPEGEKGWEKFTLVKESEKPLTVAYAGLLKGVAKLRWLPVIFALLMLLAFLAWSSHRPRAVRVRRRVNLTPAEASGEPATLTPL